MSVLNARFNKKKGEKPRVLLLYCTCNDFNAEALETCMRQRYDHFHTVILDDSKDEEYKRKIDEFAQTHDVTVVRRENRVGFKAGNLNNYLQGRTDYGSQRTGYADLHLRLYDCAVLVWRKNGDCFRK